MTQKHNEKFANVWDALESGPTVANMTMRSDLLIALQRQVGVWKITPAKAARRLKTTPSRLNDLLDGRIANFSLEALVSLAVSAKLRVRLEIGPTN
ncbi:MAG: XRE family transcriptional regulator [Proteobacteria bacterium]|nr:XRE family transcriptional regulator [Pseudomonadota bacterium]